MKIAAVCTAYHEVDILPSTVRHLFGEGIDQVIVQTPLNDKETGDSIAGSGALVVCEEEDYHDQPATIIELAKLAHSFGADWIIPFDADEFIYSATDTETIRDTLAKLTVAGISSLTIPMYQQHDWWWREPGPKPLPKIAYRFNPGAKVGPGNHTVTGLPEGATVAHNVLHLREIQYRGYEHFKRKITERNATIDPSLGPEFGWHHKQFANASEGDLLKAWMQYLDRPVVWDPVPTIHRPAFDGPTFTMRQLLKQAMMWPSDIQGHLQRLHDVVGIAKANAVVECGVNTGMSTIAFLATDVEVYSCDVIQPRVRPEVADAPNWHFHLGSDLDWQPPAAEVYFIDTSHEYRHSAEELKKFWPLVPHGGCMIWHDTHGQYDGQQGRAIKHWLQTVRPSHVEDYQFCEGLTVFWK